MINRLAQWTSLTSQTRFGGLMRWIFVPGMTRKWSTKLYIDATTPSAHSLSAVKKGDLVDLELDDSLFLKKMISLPVAAKKNLKKIVDLQIRQSSPGGGETLVWRSIIERKSKQEIVVHVLLIKKQVLADLTSHISDRGAQLRSIRIANLPRAEPLTDNSQRTDRVWTFWNYIIAVMSIGFCIFILWHTNGRITAQEAQVQQLQSKKAALELDAIQLRKRLDQNNANFSEISHDIGIFEAGFLRLPLFLELTEMLGDDTWISDLTLNTGTLNLSGFSGGEVTAIMPDLRTLSWVSGVELLGPISFDSFSRRNRFELSIKIDGLK